MTKPIQDDFDESAFFGAEARAPQAPGGNPLTRYYRLPGLHVPLPTRGAFMPPGSVEFTPKGDVPVMPMRAADEMLLKSPDALMSGYAIEKLIESCVPAVKTPNLLSQPDLDVLLLAIRAATNGTSMTVHTECPSCGAEGEFECDLGNILSTMKTIPPENPVRLSDDVIVYVRPHNVGESFRIATASFEEYRQLQALETQGVADEVKSKQANASLDRINKLTLAVTASCIVKVQVPEGPVEDRQAIADFIANVPGPWVKRVTEKLKAVNAMGIDRSVEATCSKCGHQWRAEVEFNPQTFFG